MAIRANDFLSSARQLVNKADEIDYRNASSRAYYAAFHYVNSINKFSLLSRGQYKNYGLHKRIIKNFETHSDPDFRKIGSLLQKCKGIRVKADYKLSLDFIKQDAEIAVGLAQGIINRVKALPAVFMSTA